MKPADIVQKMLDADHFSRWLGIELLELEPGRCMLKMQVTKDMLNGFGIAHGGISFSLADSALAFASNSKGKQSLSIETSISHIVSAKQGDRLIAKAHCVAETGKLGHYQVEVLREGESQALALFKGIVYKTEKDWS